MRWVHVPICLDYLAIICFVRVYFGTGRLWLAAAAIGIRVLILVVNFSVWPNVNYAHIDSVEQVTTWGGAQFAVGHGQIRAWTRLAQVGTILFLAFVVDASIAAWRRGDAVSRHKAVWVGGSLLLFMLLAATHTALVQQAVVRSPYFVSLPFLIPLIIMAWQLAADVAHVPRLSKTLAQSQSDLHSADDRVELAAEAAKLGFWEWDFGRDDIWTTGQFRSTVGLDPAERVDLARFLRAVHPDDRQGVEHAIRHSLTNGGEYDRQYRIVLPDGRTRWLASRGRVERNGHGETKRMRGVIFDVTQRREAEMESVKQRNELAHLSRVTMLGELSGSLAHELNQPLTAILSNAQAAQRFLAREQPDLEELRGILKDIVAEDKRAGEVIYRLRELFKKGEVQQQALDANELVREVLKFLNSDLVNHMVSTRTEFEEALPLVQGDRVQLQQVLINLVVNSCDAMSDQPPATRELLIRTASTENQTIHISVIDRGCGIRPNCLEVVFEPFITTKQHGMGLGLPVCRTIITAHGGSLWATNNTDRGATFHISLPIHNEAGVA
jgi:PAS domain S-box-containing protein